MAKTKIQIINEIGTTKGTFYRHMSKLGIDKGKILTNKDIEKIRISISGTSKGTGFSTTELEKVQAELKSNLYDKDVEITQMQEKLEETLARLEQKESEVNNLQTELTNNMVVTNQLSTEHIKLINEYRLLSSPKDAVQKENQEVRIDTTVDGVEHLKEVQTKEKKKRWWRK